MKRSLLLMLLVTACGQSDRARQLAPAEQKMAESVAADMPASAPPPGAKRESARRGRPMKKTAPKGFGGNMPSEPEPMAEGEAMDLEEEKKPDDDAGGAPTRSWFPETFLFEPLVETSASGSARMLLKVPDRLTTWRVLALAHTRSGAQAGAVARFLGTLPVYVDPVVPAFLVQGDDVSLPVQVVNTTTAAVSTTLRLTFDGLVPLSASERFIKLGPNGSTVEMVRVKASKVASAQLFASLSGADAVARTIPVRANGRPFLSEWSQTLSSARTIRVAGLADADPSTAELRLSIFPGALSVVKSELSSALSRGDIADDAYALLLSGRATEILQKLGEAPDKDALRRLELVAFQRLFAHARSPDVLGATLLLEPVLSKSKNPILERLSARLAQVLANEQRPDGSFGGGRGFTLQRVLATTAEATRALSKAEAREDLERYARLSKLRASAMFERNIGHVKDSYTAALILASGAVDSSLRARLLKVVKESIQLREDGTRVVDPGKGVVRADGQKPSEVEATALAILALEGDEESKGIWPDLGSALLSRYRPSVGFGDGRTNLVALDAMTRIFREPVPDKITVTMSMGDTVLSTTVLEGRATRDVAHAVAAYPAVREDNEITVRATPPLAGLAFRLVRRAFVPWKEEASESGLELSATVADDKLTLGKAVDVELAALAPAGMAFEIDYGLWAGAVVDTERLKQLAGDGTVTSYETEDGRVTLHVPVRAPGETFKARLRVIPTLSGQLTALPATITPEYRPDRAQQVAPKKWVVAN